MGKVFFIIFCFFFRFLNTGVAVKTPTDQTSPFSPIPAQNNFESPVKLPHMPRLSFPDTLLPRPECQSPIPRRKQARPRRRSGELCGPQDLSVGLTKLGSPEEETAENLCIKKQTKESKKEIKQVCMNIQDNTQIYSFD